MRIACFLVLAAGCGRFGFEEQRVDAGDVIDGRHDDSGPTAACSSALICDGFEGTTFGNGWTPEGAVAIDTTFAHSGDSSVHMHLDAIPANGTIGARLIHWTVLAAPGPLWVRAWMKLGSLPAGGNRMETICAEQSTSPYFGDCVFLHSAATSLYTQFSPASMEGSAPPVGPWFCFVWSIVRASDASGAMQLTSDVIPDISLTGEPTDSATNPNDALAMGGIFYSGNTPDPQPALDVWFDDVIVSTSPVTCAD